MTIGKRSGCSHGFTIPEVVVSIALCLVVAGGTLACGLFYTKLTEVTQSKITTSNKARQIQRLFAADVNSAQLLRIGEGGLRQFTATDGNVLQRGNALQIHPSSDTNAFIRYYIDQIDRKLKRITNGSSEPFIVASFITNTYLFAAEDFAGKALTNSRNNTVISMTLHFDYLEEPIMPIGAGKHYQAYQLHTRVNCRSY